MSALLSRFSRPSVVPSAIATVPSDPAPINLGPTRALYVRPQTVQPVPVAPVQSVEKIEKLRPVIDPASTGSQLREAQKPDAATDEGFASVNRQWYRQTLDYDAARSAIAGDRGECLDVIAPRARFAPSVDDSGRFALLDSETGGKYRPTENALQQLAGWTDTGLTLPKRLAEGDDGDRDTLRVVMANGWRKIPADKNLLLRLRTDGTLRAVLSDSYRRVDNGWFLDVLESLIPGGRVSHLRGDGDAWFFNVLIPDSLRVENDSQYGAMIAAGNSEIGTRTVGTLPSVFRWICFNGNIWDQVEGVAYTRRVHRGQWELSELRAEIADNLHRQIPLLSTGIDRLLALRSIAAPKGLPDLSVIGTVLDAITTAQITRPMAGRIVAGFADQRTEAGFVSAFDIVNGITKAAQEFAPSVQESVERAAGELTAVWTPDRWDTAFSAAKSFRESDAKRIFTLDVAATMAS